MIGPINFFKLMVFKVKKVVEKKEVIEKKFELYIPTTKESTNEGGDSYLYEGIRYIPYLKSTKAGDPYHLKNLETGSILIVTPEKNEASIVDSKHNKVWEGTNV